jgi:hypothetical protein
MRIQSTAVCGVSTAPYPSTHVMELYTRNLDGSGPAHGDSSVRVRFSASTPVLHNTSELGERGEKDRAERHVGAEAKQGSGRRVAASAGRQIHPAESLTRARSPPH